MEYSPMALSHTMERVTYHNPSALPSMASCATETVRSAKSVRMLSPLAVRCREMLYEMQAYKTAFVGAFELFITGDLGPNIQITGFVNALQIAEVMYEDLRCRDKVLQHTYSHQGRLVAEDLPTRRGIRDVLRSFANAICHPLRHRGDSSKTEVAQCEADGNQNSDVNTGNDPEKQSVCNTEPTPVKTAENKTEDMNTAPRKRRGFLRRIRHALSRLCRRH